MTIKLSKKILLIGISIISIAPISIFLSCSNQSQSIENQLLDLEFSKNVQLRIGYSQEQLEKINLLDLGSNTEQLDENGSRVINPFNNEQLANIFILPEAKTAETNDEYGIFYSWDFTKKDIVSFDRNGNILFEVYVSAGLKTSKTFTTRPRVFVINIEDTIIEEESQNIDLDGNPIIVEKPASRYVYKGIDENGDQIAYKFQSVRKDVFEKSKEFNIDFYSQNSLINNRPVFIESGATSESAIDAYTNKRLIKSPSPTSVNGTKYRFNIESADFDESNNRKGIYRIRVTPESDRIFDSNFTNYAKDKYNISFNKYYYYYEKNANFKKPTESNISSHNSINTTEATRISDSITNSELAFIPILKDPGSIVGKNAEEIVNLNNKTPGGLFLPPTFVRQYSIEPYKPVSIDISSVTSQSNKELVFSMIIKVGSGEYQVTKTIDKIVDIKNLRFII